MSKFIVLIGDPDVATIVGELIDGEPEVGEQVTVLLHDENGMPIEVTGTFI